MKSSYHPCRRITAVVWRGRAVIEMPSRNTARCCFHSTSNSITPPLTMCEQFLFVNLQTVVIYFILGGRAPFVIIESGALPAFPFLAGTLIICRAVYLFVHCAHFIALSNPFHYTASSFTKAMSSLLRDGRSIFFILLHGFVCLQQRRAAY